MLLTFNAHLPKECPIFSFLRRICLVENMLVTYSCYNVALNFPLKLLQQIEIVSSHDILFEKKNIHHHRKCVYHTTYPHENNSDAKSLCSLCT